MIKSFITAIVLVILNGCAGVSDIYEELPNGYVYVSESKEQKVIVKNPLSLNSNLYVPSIILDYKYNRDYIIAKIQFHYNSRDGSIGFQEQKRLKEGNVYYYIIDTKRDMRYGEFSNYQTFLKKLKELNVSLVIDK